MLGNGAKGGRVKTLILWVGAIWGLVILGATNRLNNLHEQSAGAYWLTIENYDQPNQIYRMFNGEQTPVNISPVTSREIGFPQWSPDGRYIFYQEGRYDSHFGVQLYRIDVKNMTRKTFVTPMNYGLQSLNWSPNRQWFAIMLINRTTDEEDVDIWRFNADGSQPINLTPTLHGYLQVGEWSDDSRWLYFNFYTNHESYDIYRVSADGSTLEQLTNWPNHNEYSPHISPDGQWLVFLGGLPDSPTADNHNDIYRMRVDGSAMEQLTASPYAEYGVRWSPDGQWLYFSYGGRDNADIYRMRPDGSAMANLTEDSPYRELTWQWSADGQWLYFTVYKNGGSNSLYRMHPDGTAQQTIVLSAKSACCYDYQMTPDNQWIYFIEANREGGDSLYKIRLDGRDRQLVVQQQINDEFYYGFSPAYDDPLATLRWYGLGGGLMASIVGFNLWQWRKGRQV